MDKIRISNGVKRIEVNDAGDYISFNIADPAFMEEYTDMMEYLDKQRDVIKTLQQEEISAEDENAYVKLKKRAQERANLCKEMGMRIDKLFGEGASRKTFGVDTPDEYQIFEFFEAIVPFIEKSKTERQELIEQRYNSSRKGAN